MKLDPAMFKILLDQLDVHDMAQHSSINHHVAGMDYLCLSRAEGLTIKLYLMEKPENSNGGYLVNPHSHRYAFSSIVLAGSLTHIRFHRTDVRNDAKVWERFEYSAETRGRRALGSCNLTHFHKFCSVGTNYFVAPHEIHTLDVCEREPLLLGLAQFHDESNVSDLYLRDINNGQMVMADTRRPTADEMLNLRFRALELLAEGGAA